MNILNLVQGSRIGADPPTMLKKGPRREGRLVRGIRAREKRDSLFHQTFTRPSVCQTSLKYGAREATPRARGRDYLSFCPFLGLGRTLFPWSRLFSRAVIQRFGR